MTTRAFRDTVQAAPSSTAHTAPSKSTYPAPAPQAYAAPLTGVHTLTRTATYPAPLRVETLVSLPRREGGRRVLNVIVAALGILIAVPLMAVIAIAVKLSSLGPVRYTQTRIGIDRRRRGTGTDTGTRRLDLGGAPFRMFKFRTMHVQTDAPQQWATAADARITPLGRILRQYRIDEIPQLFNVLRGDMNVVGPRPEQPQIFAHLRTRIARYAHRQHVRPGITGWAQVNLAYDRTEDDVRQKLHFDLEYIRRQSLSEDLRIMIRTLPVMLGRRGAQ